jgi:predicted short-subunit dehydrogenase-like oxidoreductase (DUF2520 family)
MTIFGQTTREILDKDTVSIIGTGNVGTALGYLLMKAGYPIVAVADQNHASSVRCAGYTGGQVYDSLPEAAEKASCIIIATPDDAIDSVCRQLSESGAIRPDQKVFHPSGAGGIELLSSARSRGAHGAAIHPIQTLADIDSAIARIPGSTFGVTADEELMAWAFQLVRDIGGKPILISESDRPLYHAAACIASNYLVTMMHIVAMIYRQFGLDSEEALRAFWPLVEGTILNIAAKGTVPSLTGPIARGDSGTVLKHMEAIRACLPSYLSFYRTMGTLTADLALTKGNLSKAKSDEIKKILEGDNS